MYTSHLSNPAQVTTGLTSFNALHISLRTVGVAVAVSANNGIYRYNQQFGEAWLSV